jgi:hypothetical protein
MPISQASRLSMRQSMGVTNITWSPRTLLKAVTKEQEDEQISEKEAKEELAKSKHHGYITNPPPFPLLPSPFSLLPSLFSPPPPSLSDTHTHTHTQTFTLPTLSPIILLLTQRSHQKTPTTSPSPLAAAALSKAHNTTKEDPRGILRNLLNAPIEESPIPISPAAADIHLSLPAAAEVSFDHPRDTRVSSCAHSDLIFWCDQVQEQEEKQREEEEQEEEEEEVAVVEEHEAIHIEDDDIGLDTTSTASLPSPSHSLASPKSKAAPAPPSSAPRGNIEQQSRKAVLATIADTLLDLSTAASALAFLFFILVLSLSAPHACSSCTLSNLSACSCDYDAIREAVSTAALTLSEAVMGSDPYSYPRGNPDTVPIGDSYDYVIVGSGMAGSTLASSLHSRDPTVIMPPAPLSPPLLPDVHSISAWLPIHTRAMMGSCMSPCVVDEAPRSSCMSSNMVPGARI